MLARMIREVSTRDRAEQRVRGLLESAPDAIVVVDGVGGIVVVNARAEALFGYTRDQLIGRSVELLVPEAKRNAHAASRHAYGANPRPRHGSRPGDFTARRKDGSVFAVEITLNRIETDDGLLVSSAIRDVTDRRRAERATARLATIVASSPNAIIGVCPDGTIESWNAAAERLYGYPASEAIGQPITIVNAPERADSRDHLDTALRGETVAFESEDLRRDGSRVETAVTISPIRDGGGAITGVACLAQDITERNRAERARARLAAIVESSEDAIMGLTIDGEITSWNRGAELIYGYRESETIGKHVSMLAPAAYEDETAALLGRVGAGERVSHSETIRLRKDGRLIDVSLTISPIRDTAGLVVGASTVARDMTERRAAEDALKRAEERFRRAFDEAPIGMALISIDGALEKVNGALVAICGYARSELEGMELCQVLHPADLDTGIAALRELATGETDGLALDLRIIPAVGSAVDVTVHGTRLGNRSNGEQRLLCQVLDVTERKRYEQRLQFMADHDPLTGLLNRRKFETELERHVEHVKRYGPEGAVLVLDVDHFKTINDTFGHNAGDQLIVSIAAVLRQRLRASDTLARLGGDEFAVLLPKADHDEAAEVAAAIIAAVRSNTSLPGGQRKMLTASLGIAMITANPEHVSGESILIEADLAMYDAKNAGRDQYSFHETPDHAPAGRPTALARQRKTTQSEMDSKEQRAALRAAVYRGDGPAVVDLLHGVGAYDDSLQLAGDGLLVAVVQRVDGAGELARSLVVSLRQRGWDGDDELADQLDALLGSGPAAAMLRALPIDLEELAGILESDPLSAGGRIDIRTGEVWPRAAIEYALKTGDEDEDSIDDPERWLPVHGEGSREGYRDMELFIASIEDPGRAGRLGSAIRGRGAFRRFKDELAHSHGELERWHALSEERQRGRARSWLAAAGYRVLPADHHDP